MKEGEKMILSRQEFANLLGVANRYLIPSNFEHFQKGAEEKGFRLLSMSGRGQKAIFEIEPLIQSFADEIWLQCPIAPGYQVSNYGRIKHPSGGIIQGYEDKGYIRINIKGKNLAVHRMVMTAFHPIDNPELFSVDHINGIKSDNRPENLRWVWQSENIQFSDKNNTEMREIVAKLVQKYGYNETKYKLLTLLG